VALLILIALATSCGGGGSSTSTPPPVTPPTTPPPAAQMAHVVLVVEENHSYNEIIGTSAMPYLSGLAAKYGLATQYYANTHPSIGNYFELTAGQTVTGDDAYARPVMVDNIVRELIASGKTWKGYAESLPSVGYIGGDVYPYKRGHFPVSYFSDVVNSGTEVNNLVPFTQFATDLANNQLPEFSLVVPNLLNDAHDGTLTQADTWLQTYIDPLLQNVAFQQGGLLIITFDEGDMADLTNGGGHVVTVLIGPNVKPAFQSTSFYQHQNTLSLVCSTLGIATCPGQASGASNMGEFLN
jgi:acid phosphatase